MRFAHVIAAAAVAVVCLTGCGGGGSAASTTGAAASSAPRTAATAHTASTGETESTPETASSAETASTPGVVSTQGAGNPAAFAWLHPGAPPPAWTVARLNGTAAMAYPPGWRRVHSDPGTVTAVRTAPHSDLILGYLNATPQQGEETLQNWASFRPAHNREEGERDERLVAAAQGLRFRNGHGSCVIDRYRTARAPYQEIACLVRAPTTATVIVAAAPVAGWAQAAPALERAVSAFLA